MLCYSVIASRCRMPGLAGCCAYYFALNGSSCVTRLTTTRGPSFCMSVNSFLALYTATCSMRFCTLRSNFLRCYGARYASRATTACSEALCWCSEADSLAVFILPTLVDTIRYTGDFSWSGTGYFFYMRTLISEYFIGGYAG